MYLPSSSSGRSARSASSGGSNQSSASLSSGSSFDSADLGDCEATGAEYDFAKHDTNKRVLDAFVAKHGAHALDPCDRLSTEIVGLHNQGATCYLNSLLQTLFFTKTFRERIYDWVKPPPQQGGPDKNEDTTNTKTQGDKEDTAQVENEKGNNDDTETMCIPLQVQRLFARLQFAEEAAVTTNDLTTSFGWSDGDAFEQQDVQELARVLFDSLEQAREGKALTEPFKGSLVDYIRCLRCSHRRARREDFQDLSLVVQDADSVPAALKDFVQVERLEGDNQYFCEHCDMKTDAVKGHRLVKLPSTLVLHLKRFEFDWETGRRSKIDDSLDIPLRIDVAPLLGLDDREDAKNGSELSPCEDNEPQPNLAEDSISDSLCEDLLACKAALQPQQYTEHDPLGSSDASATAKTPTSFKLSAIIVHQGGANSGHYYAVARTGEESWHEFNDTFVSQVDEDEVKRMCRPGGCLADGGAYMLFYTREGDESAQGLARSVMPRQDLIDWVQQRNEQRSFLRRVRAMDNKLVRIRVIASAAVDSNHRAIPNMPTSTVITLHGGKATPADVKNRAYRQLVPQAAAEVCPLVRCRLRRVRENMHRIGAVIEETEDRTLEELGFVGQATLLLEICPPWIKAQEDAKELVGDSSTTDVAGLVQVRLFMWDSNLCQPLPLRAGRCESNLLSTDSTYSLHTSMLPIVLPESLTLTQARTFIAGILDIDATDLRLLRAKDLLHNKRSTSDRAVEVLEESLQDTGVAFGQVFHSGDGVLIARESQQSASAVANAYDEAMSYLEVSFNDPRLNQRGEPVQYEHSIRVKREMTLCTLKERLLQSLDKDLDSDQFHLRSAAKAPQIKDTSQTVEQAGFSDHSVVHLGKGKPIPAGKMLMRIFLRNSPEVAARVFVPERALIDDVRAAVSMELKVSSVRIFDRSPRGEEGDELHDGMPMRRLADGRSVFVELGPSTQEPSQEISDELKAAPNHDKNSNVKGEPALQNPSQEPVCEHETTTSLNKSSFDETEPVKDTGHQSCSQRGNPLKAAMKVKPPTWQLDSDGVENFTELTPGHASRASLQRVPSLDLASLPPVDERTSYQEEFEAQKDQWSESWRAAAEAEAAGLDQEDSLEPRQSPSKSKLLEENVFAPGARVLAKDPQWKRFFPGTIFSHCQDSDTFAVDFDDGDRLESVSRAYLRAQASHQALPQAGPTADVSLAHADMQEHETVREGADAMQVVEDNHQDNDRENEEQDNNTEAGSAQDIVRGLEASDDLCPADKKARRREKIATRDFRLQLLHMEASAAPTNNFNPEPVIEPIKPTRAQSSPSRSRARVYLSDGQSRQNRVQSSKISRPKTLEPLAARPQASVIPGPRDPLEVAPQSRIPRLAALRPSNKVGPNALASPRVPFKHSARVLRDARLEPSHQEDDPTLSQAASSLPRLER
ncbi:Ubiquitin carboxyl-terminal hydrolase 47 [Hondaea fermentalgiana]|uniref:Ubiquitin carboxyl-terminal hydrolase 47 n=1 Tax=Hondaea fermentalgiana TaxID=2315210 RepID=A0A2R5G793_9STRA|nr:Ubiquitin carboxyl-terminal hydrolase 47 [Hondaea fermentalgiana]|eukprot:GBG23911.1 Ubiquitin carboxyl-terminal hydrolase 47 [Hondaea fermentalgiana]